MPSSDNTNCVSIRARVRKSHRAIDPEFDECRETLVSFVASSTNNTKQTSSKTNGPSLVLTPVPSQLQGSARSLSRGNMAPVKRRLRSFGPNNPATAERKASGTSLSSSELSNEKSEQQQGAEHEFMMDVSLEDEKVERGESEVINGSYNNNNHSSNLNASQHSIHSLHKPGLPKHPSRRYSSPLAVHRTSSAISAGGTSSISVTQSDTHLSNSVRSQSSRSARSRSRSRSKRRMGGGHLRMRSLGAASAFAAAGSGTVEEEEVGEVVAEPISIPLGDILSVDEEVPSRNQGSSAGCGSDFYSSAASDVGAATKENGSGTQLLSPSPPPSSTNNGRSLYRIFLHTLSHGYVEFSLDHCNSYDIFMAYLKAHLQPDRIPQRNGLTSAAKLQKGEFLRTMVLTPTKELPSHLASSTHPTNGTKINNAASTAPPTHPRALPRPHLTRSNSTISCNIDKLHSKVIHQRLQNESTPMHRMKEQLASWMSSMMDCACCQDTTVAPMEVEDGSKGGIHAIPEFGRLKQQGGGSAMQQRQLQKGRSPNSERLRGKGIGGLSFEEMSSGPRLSFERSVGGDSKR